jgi:hypothetical protein
MSPNYPSAGAKFHRKKAVNRNRFNALKPPPVPICTYPKTEWQTIAEIVDQQKDEKICCHIHMISDGHAS